MQAMHHYGQALEVLFYEILDMPLREYEQLKHMKVSHTNPMQTTYCWRFCQQARTGLKPSYMTVPLP